MQFSYPKFAERIKALRKAKGLSQKQLALKAGISLYVVKRHESGKPCRLTKHLVRLADFFGVTTDKLLLRD